MCRRERERQRERGGTKIKPVMHSFKWIRILIERTCCAVGKWTGILIELLVL